MALIILRSTIRESSNLLSTRTLHYWSRFELCFVKSRIALKILVALCTLTLFQLAPRISVSRFASRIVNSRIALLSSNQVASRAKYMVPLRLHSGLLNLKTNRVCVVVPRGSFVTSLRPAALPLG